MTFRELVMQILSRNRGDIATAIISVKQYRWLLALQKQQHEVLRSGKEYYFVMFHTPREVGHKHYTMFVFWGHDDQYKLHNRSLRNHARLKRLFDNHKFFDLMNSGDKRALRIYSRMADVEKKYNEIRVRSLTPCNKIELRWTNEYRNAAKQR